MSRDQFTRKEYSHLELSLVPSHLFVDDSIDSNHTFWQALKQKGGLSLFSQPISDKSICELGRAVQNNDNVEIRALGEDIRSILEISPLNVDRMIFAGDIGRKTCVSNPRDTLCLIFFKDILPTSLNDVTPLLHKVLKDHYTIWKDFSNLCETSMHNSVKHTNKVLCEVIPHVTGVSVVSELHTIRVLPCTQGHNDMGSSVLGLLGFLSNSDRGLSNYSEIWSLLIEECRNEAFKTLTTVEYEILWFNIYLMKVHCLDEIISTSNFEVILFLFILENRNLNPYDMTVNFWLDMRNLNCLHRLSNVILPTIRKFDLNNIRSLADRHARNAHVLRDPFNPTYDLLGGFTSSDKRVVEGTARGICRAWDRPNTLELLFRPHRNVKQKNRLWRLLLVVIVTMSVIWCVLFGEVLGVGGADLMQEAYNTLVDTLHSYSK